MATEMQLQQALFGYDSGHHLLQSSVSLPTEVTQALAIATDLSGSASAKSFDAAFTGMPVLGTEYYALFCTWLAPEMRRPGCVWSHVLLIEGADLARIEDLGSLREYFRRPESQKSDRYSNPLQLRSSRLETASEFRGDELTDCWVAALYGEPQSSVVVPATTAKEHEELVFALWSQQWPRLRRNFRFSTGSFGDRSNFESAFDLQITPASSRRAWFGGGEHLLLDEYASAADESSRWTRVAVEDLLVPGESGFRSFLQANGVDVNTPRAAFAKLARSFIAIKKTESSNWTSALATVAKEFPAPNEAMALKRSCVLLPTNEPRNSTMDRVWWCLNWIFRENANGAFSQVSLDLTSTVALLWPAKRNEIVDLLSAPPVAAGERRWSVLAHAVAKAVAAADLPWLWSRQPELVPTLVRIEPEIATNSAVWHLPERAQWRLIEALESHSNPPVPWPRIVTAMLQADTTVGVGEIVHVAGKEVFDGVLHWTGRAGGRLPPDTWRQAITGMATERLKQGGLSPLELAFCVTLLPPYIVEKISANRSDVQELSSQTLDSLPEALRMPAAFFLVAVGLRGNGLVGTAALSQGFFATHTALASQTEPPESWRLLQRQLPAFRWWDWDRCAKLRDRVSDWFDENDTHQILLAAARTNAERQLARSLRGRTKTSR